MTDGKPMEAMTLAELRADWGRSRHVAMPIAGAIAWTVIGVCGAVLPLQFAVWAVFIGTGFTFPLAVLVGRVIGESVTASKNPLDDLLFKSVIMAALVFAIAIPFFMVKPDSLPLTLGIFPGINYMILGWILRHWVGYFHAVARTVLVTAAWFALPDAHSRFAVIPWVVVGVYAITVYFMATRRRC